MTSTYAILLDYVLAFYCYPPVLESDYNGNIGNNFFPRSGGI